MEISYKSSIVIFLTVLAIGGASAALAKDQADKPKSNMFARAKVLSSNEISITISHSDWGKKAAFEFAAKHCAKFNRLAVYQGGSAQFGPDTTSTWACVPMPQPTGQNQ